jgi:hypothetical protein
MPLELLHRTVCDLFAVGLSLASCVGLVREPANSRLTAAIDDLDELIRLLRAAAFIGHQQHLPPADSGPSSFADIDCTVATIRRTASDLEQLVTASVRALHHV